MAAALATAWSARPSKAGGPREPPASTLNCDDDYMVLATLLSTPLTLVPTLVIATIAATAISEAIKVYSIAVAPRSFFVRRRKMDSMEISQSEIGDLSAVWGGFKCALKNDTSASPCRPHAGARSPGQLCPLYLRKSRPLGAARSVGGPIDRRRSGPGNAGADGCGLRPPHSVIDRHPDKCSRLDKGC